MDVTQEGDVLFEVIVPEPLIEPVRLQINYTDIGNPVTPYHIINTTSAYLGHVSFLHREYRSQVPFDDFRVGVRLLPRDKLTDTIIGPLVQDPVDYGELLLCISNFPGPIPAQPYPFSKLLIATMSCLQMNLSYWIAIYGTIRVTMGKPLIGCCKPIHYLQLFQALWYNHMLNH